jgi:hypothetical protein
MEEYGECTTHQHAPADLYKLKKKKSENNYAYTKILFTKTNLKRKKKKQNARMEPATY